MSKSHPVCDAGANVALGCVDGQVLQLRAAVLLT